MATATATGMTGNEKQVVGYTFMAHALNHAVELVYGAVLIVVALEFGASIALLGVVANVSALSYGLSAFPAGAIVDKVGVEVDGGPLHGRVGGGGGTGGVVAQRRRPGRSPGAHGSAGGHLSPRRAVTRDAGRARADAGSGVPRHGREPGHGHGADPGRIRGGGVELASLLSGLCRAGVGGGGPRPLLPGRGARRF